MDRIIELISVVLIKLGSAYGIYEYIGNVKCYLKSDEIAYLLSIQAIGIGITTFCISQLKVLTDSYENYKDKELTTQGDHSILKEEHVLRRSKILLFRSIEMLGLGYYLSVLLLVISRLIPSSLYNILVNMSFIFAVISTCSICVSFVMHRILKNKLEGVSAFIRIFTHLHYD